MSKDRDDWLKDYIAQKIDRALNDEDGDVSDLREFNFDCYYGKPYGDERDGKSKFITREVFEAIEWAMPSVLRVFTANERAVEFVPESEEDETQAEQETDIANYYIHKENNGFLIIHNWLKDILMYPNGYVKCYPEECRKVTVENISGILAEDFQRIEQDPEVEILEAEAYQEFVDGFGPQELFKVKVRYTRTEKKVRIEPISSDECLVDDQHTDVDVEDANFICHRVRRTISDLVEMGYDYDELQLLGDVDENTFASERTNRLFYEEENPDSDDDGDQEGAGRMLWVHEISIKADYDEDGIAERRRVVMIGDKVFDNEVDEYQPIVSCASIIMPHKHIGMSYIESVSDLQRLSTTLWRQTLDNIYAHTDKRHFFREESLLEDNSTMDDYLNGASSAIIVRGNPAEAVMPEVNAPITQELLNVSQDVRQQTTLRTGVSPELSLDPNILKQSTEGAFANALDQASQRLDMLVRTIAEVGYKRLMQKVQYCLRTHVNTPSQVKIRGNWVQFDPSTWKDRTKMQVNVGLGFNNKEQKIQLLMGVLDIQREALSQNLTGVDKIYNTLERMVEAAGIGSAGRYFNDPTEPGWEPPQPQPDPQAEMLQAQAQALTAEQQRKAQEMQLKAQVDFQKMQQDMQKMQDDLRLEREKLALERAKFEAQWQLDSNTNLSDFREARANEELKRAQATLAYSNAGQAEATAKKTAVESSAEYREAQDIVQNGIEGPKQQEAAAAGE